MLRCGFMANAMANQLQKNNEKYDDVEMTNCDLLKYMTYFVFLYARMRAVIIYLVVITVVENCHRTIAMVKSYHLNIWLNVLITLQ